MPGAIIDIGKMSDEGLAASMRSQLRYDIISGQTVPPMQQLIIEAIARILEAPSTPLLKGEGTVNVTGSGEIRTAGRAEIMKR